MGAAQERQVKGYLLKVELGAQSCLLRRRVRYEDERHLRSIRLFPLLNQLSHVKRYRCPQAASLQTVVVSVSAWKGHSEVANCRTSVRVL